jgi:uncharacterized membrane protein
MGAAGGKRDRQVDRQRNRRCYRNFGGYEFRARLVQAIGDRDLPIALLEDVCAIGLAYWSTACL